MKRNIVHSTNNNQNAIWKINIVESGAEKGGGN